MIDLDKIEAVARKARDARPGEWVSDRLMTADWHEPMNDGEGYAIVSSGGDVVIDGGMCIETADHIATCSPDVVLEMAGRIRVLEGALRRAVHAGTNIDFAYEDAHRQALRDILDDAGLLVGFKPGDPCPL